MRRLRKRLAQWLRRLAYRIDPYLQGVPRPRRKGPQEPPPLLAGADADQGVAE